MNPKYKWLTNLKVVKTNGDESTISLNRREMRKLKDCQDLLFSHCTVDKFDNSD